MSKMRTGLPISVQLVVEEKDFSNFIFLFLSKRPFVSIVRWKDKNIFSNFRRNRTFVSMGIMKKENYRFGGKSGFNFPI